MKHYDAIIIGSGQAGTPLSTELAQAGLKTALIERIHVGGTCVNEGCTPTKTMVASARIAYLARRVAHYGVHLNNVSVNMAEVRERKQAVVNDFRNGNQQYIEKTKGVDLIFGEASFTSAKSLKVALNKGGAVDLSADKIFINTGTRAAKPPIPGLSEIPTLDNVSIMELDTLPEHLIAIGGGYIGLEFAQMFRRYGSKVTVIHNGAKLMGREDPDIADEVEKILREDGIEIVLEAQTLKAEKEGGRIKLAVRNPDGEREIAGSHLLIAAGRTPNTDRLNLEAAGVEVGKGGFVVVNDKLETNVSGVYALGDVKGGPQFTHISYDDYRIIRNNLLRKANDTFANRMIPYTMFIDPQLGRIGLPEQEAKEKKLNYRVAKLPMSRVARAIEMGETRGFMKAIVDPDTGQILGAAVLGIEGGEIMAMIQIAMMGKLPYTALKEGIFAHPTLAESLNNLFAGLD